MQGQCFEQISGARWALYHADSVLALPGLPDNSIHLSVSSWPFSDQYSYSDALNDFGNCDGDEEFFIQMDYLIPELYRVTLPGRLACVHVKDRTVYGTKNDGFRCIEPFSDKCTTAMRKHGWLFFGRITVATDPVRENAQTHGLTHGELQKDASRLGVGMPEYVLLYRKPHTQTARGGQWSDVPVDSLTPDVYSLPQWQLDANSFWRSGGARLPMPYERDGYNYCAHVRYLEDLDARGMLGRANGEPVPTNNPWVWWDINRTDVLNARLPKGSDEKHICPLQLDLIERCIVRWSNPDEVVLDYFAGIGSVPLVALKLGRYGAGIELKREYYQWACDILTKTEFDLQQPVLFDLREVACERTQLD
jgi:DNA modification methylase